MIEQAPNIIQREQTLKLIEKLQKNGELQKIQNEYLYWDKIKYKAKDCSPVELWSEIKFFRTFGRKEIKFQSYKFSFVLTDYIQKFLHLFDTLIGSELLINIGVEDNEKYKFTVSSLMEEAISSSQMEGANTTRKVAKEMIKQERRPKNKSEQMILNNFITMKHIVQIKDEELTVENMLNIHKLVTNNTLEESKDEGKFRENDDVHVVNHANSEVVHIPPPQSELKSLINELCLFFNADTEEFIHPVIKGSIIHFMIGWIHPFTDGNGRTARALFYWYMLNKGYWITEYLSISRIIKDTKTQYEKAYLYSEIDDNDLTYFINYHIKTIEKAIDALNVYIKLKKKETVKAVKFMKIPGVNDRMAQILNTIQDDPHKILNAKEMESTFNVSNYTARADLRALVELGFLEKIQVNKQKQNFIKSSTFEKTLYKYKL